MKDIGGLFGGGAGSKGDHVLITGGAGFIGANLADRLLSNGEKVVLLDNLSRPGVERNHAWLANKHGGAVRLVEADIRTPDAVRTAVADASAVFHFAAQVAVTTSLKNPLVDFSVNLEGTLNVLEALCASNRRVPLVFTSTNKVYGCLEDVELAVVKNRYAPAKSTRETGISERQRLDFTSPYGCSKGAADQYVLDYARSFQLPAIVFRMSCIYGPRQFGTEDQGWVAHFLIQAMEKNPITIYGDGRQVRDILFVEDLLDALVLARRHSRVLCGQAFNIGGGPANATSLLELIEAIGKLRGEIPEIRKREWRTGDQRYYVSDTGKFRKATGWAPRVGIREGVRRLHQWLQISASKRRQPAAVAA